MTFNDQSELNISAMQLQFIRLNNVKSVVLRLLRNMCLLIHPLSTENSLSIDTILIWEYGQVLPMYYILDHPCLDFHPREL